MNFFNKLKYILHLFLFHNKKFLSDSTKVMSPKIKDIYKILAESATVENLIKISSSIHTIYHINGKFKTIMPREAYKSYDVGPVKIYDFTNNDSESIKDDEAVKLYNLFTNINLGTTDVYCIKINDKYQYFFLRNEGKNGSGDFVDDDMKNVTKLLDDLKKYGVSWRCVTDVSIDIPDDVSYWAITFTID